MEGLVLLDFFFGTWPNGPGPAIVQIALFIGGAAGGIRVVDDIKYRLERTRTATD